MSNDNEEERRLTWRRRLHLSFARLFNLIKQVRFTDLTLDCEITNARPSPRARTRYPSNELNEVGKKKEKC